MSTVDASVVIVSFNTRDLLADCLASLSAAAGDLAWQAVVVDNGSSDGTPAMLREHFPEVGLVEAGGNVGFARGINVGIARAIGRVVLWLNPDCVMAPGSVAALVGYLDEHHSVGVVGPRLIHADGRIQPSAQAFPGGIRVLYHFLGLRSLAGARRLRPLWRLVAPRAGAMTRSYLESLDPGTAPRVVDWVSGACLAAPAAVVARIGPLDEDYFMYCEDTDWCQRVRAAGLGVHYLPGVEVTHHVGASAPANPTVSYHYYRSLLLYFLKHHPGQFGWIRLIMLVGFGLRGVGRELARLFGRAGGHPWWRLAALCLAPASLREARR